jgi:Fe-S cluster assembly iron-binding protein IscA
LGLALDESTPNDEVFNHSGVSYVVEKKLLTQVQPITVEYIESARGSGFQVQGNLGMGSGCGSCSGC